MDTTVHENPVITEKHFTIPDTAVIGFYVVFLKLRGRVHAGDHAERAILMQKPIWVDFRVIHQSFLTGRCAFPPP